MIDAKQTDIYGGTKYYIPADAKLVPYITNDELYSTDWDNKLNELTQERSFDELAEDEQNAARYYETMRNKKIFNEHLNIPQTDVYGGEIFADFDKSKYLPTAIESLLNDNPIDAMDIAKFMVNTNDYPLDTNRLFNNSTLSSLPNIQNNNSNNTVSIKVDGGVHIDTPLDQDFANEIAYGIIDGVQMNYDINKNINN